jgi:hypothetical protein
VQDFELSVSEFPVFATDNANLSAFERDGGKIQPTQRPLCMYPYLSKYVGGSPDSLNSYTCVLLIPAQQHQLTALN